MNSFMRVILLYLALCSTCSAQAAERWFRLAAQAREQVALVDHTSVRGLATQALAAPVVPVAHVAAASPVSPAPHQGRELQRTSTDEPIRVLVMPAGDTVLASPVPGRIVMLYAALGQPFKKGDVLVSLDCQEPQARLGMARADLATATEQHEAKLRLQGLDQASDVEVALAASAVAKARSQIELIQAQIGQCTIRAPWAGQTARLHVRNYMTISAGQPLLDLVRSGPSRLKINVPSRWIGRLSPGQSFDIHIDETERRYPAQVRLINSRVDPVSQTIEVEGNLSRQYPELLPGMSGVAVFPGLN